MAQSSPIGDDLYKAFLEEMQSLENFRVSYTSVHSQASVDREDPEVRRLIDAMAFFAARTRTAALRNLLSTQRRLFEQYFAFLVSPMPSMAMVQAVLTGKFAEAVTLPPHTELMIAPEGRQGALFRTMSELRLLPIRLEDVTTLLRSRSGYRIVLSFASAYPRRDELGTLPLYVNHLDDYPASLGLLHHLKKHLEQAIVCYDEERIDDLTEGAACEISTGAIQDPDELPELSHPIQQVRSFFHFPQRELFLNVEFPKTEKEWKRFAVCFDVDSEWPKNLRLNKDMFQLFTVPIWNLKRSAAEPISCDGTKVRFPLRFPTPQAKFSIHSVTGVFEIREKGLQPLKPGIIKGGSGSYEIERTIEPTGPTTWLKLQFPEAFATPKKISVDAFWYQPWFAKDAGAKLKVGLHSRNIIGGSFELRGEVKTHVENPLKDDFEAMLQVLALKSKAVGYNQDDVSALLNALGTLPQSQFRELASMITEVNVTRSPASRGKAGGQEYLYKFKVKELDATSYPVVELGLRQLARLLEAWTTDARVKVEATFEGVDGKVELS